MGELWHEPRFWVLTPIGASGPYLSRQRAEASSLGFRVVRECPVCGPPPCRSDMHEATREGVEGGED